MKTLLLTLLAAVSLREIPPRNDTAQATITATPLTLSPEGMRLILDHEVGGGSVYYNRSLIHPTWPGGASGITIGIGYDLGHNTRERISRDWSMLPAGTLARLQSCAGITGAAASLMAPSVRDILIPWDTALSVYQRSTIPRFASLTESAYPGTHTLHPHIQSAMLSWTFNRGPGIHPTSSRDLEKRAIRSAIPRQPTLLPAQFRASKRLWADRNLNGLLRRREDEARLIESALR